MADAHSKPVWFITGCSTGFGRELSLLLLKRGYRVVATARDKAKIDDIVAGHEQNGLALRLDVDKQDQIEAAVKAAETRFGRIDVLVNNAGYGYLAAVEEGDDADIRAMFETNFFGLAAMTRAALPIMRAQKSGAIVNISSMGGFIGFPGSGYYAATQVCRRGHVGIAFQGGRAARDQGHYRRARPVPHRLGRPFAQRRRSTRSTPTRRRRIARRRQIHRAISGKQPGDPVRGPKRSSPGRTGEAAVAARARRFAYEAMARSSHPSARNTMREKRSRAAPTIRRQGEHRGRLPSEGADVGSVRSQAFRRRASLSL